MIVGGGLLATMAEDDSLALAERLWMTC